MIALPIGRTNALRDAFGSDFEVDTDMLRDAVLHARSANAFYLPVVTKIDFFGRGYEPFDESEFSRRRPAVVRAGGETIVVKSAEDTVLRKLLWFREGGEVSEKQWRDIVSVLLPRPRDTRARMGIGPGESCVCRSSEPTGPVLGGSSRACVEHRQ